MSEAWKTFQDTIDQIQREFEEEIAKARARAREAKDKARRLYEEAMR